MKIKVISGDDPRTVSHIAIEAGIEGADKYVSLSGLSDEEVKSLFGNKGYETYVGAKKQMHASELWGFVFALSLIGDAAGLSGMIHWNTEDDRLKSTALFSGSLLLTNVSIPLMCVFRGVGKGRLNWLVDDFNERHNNSMSFSIVPSLMNCEMPQLQNNYGVGLTIKMKF